MDVLILTLFILIVLFCIIFLSYMIIYNKLNDYIIRINEVEANIDTSLRNKYDLINRSISIIKSNMELDNKVFDEIIKLRSRKISNFELERKLTSAFNELIILKNKYKELSNNEELVKINVSLEDINEKLAVLIDYYNNNITSYNKLITMFPTNIVAKINKYKTKLFFDMKDMSDNDYNDFIYISIYFYVKKKDYLIVQSISLIPFLLKNSFVLEKGLLPKNP